ncbi:hypothetical protein FSARC_14537 [Fusarium sarcochroum]|uniref:Uncharacterized protein n=1 Tax=Fusarium sarcochroum TaxID=1208366 RepID=A0A8H4SSQ4_9HYPO|nr:hypothetical protein FSARC_14537 [Fusarium sarcochroum]
MESLVDLAERSMLVDYGNPMEVDDDDSSLVKTTETSTRIAKALGSDEKDLNSEPIQTFNKNYRQIVSDWNSLKDETRILNLASSSDPRIIRSFKIIDLVLCGRRGSTLLCRLANVHLMDLFSIVERLVSFERKSGHAVRKPHYRDASVALDIYMSAQEDRSNSSVLR